MRFESFTRKFLQCAARASFFVDVGAEFGLYSFLAFREMPRDGLIYCIEPDPPRFVALYEKISADRKCNSRMFCLNQAIAGAPGELALYQTGHNSSTIKAPAPPPPGTVETDKKDEWTAYSVPANTLDHLFRDRPIDILKMDIEAAELLAVEGMKAILETGRTRIFLEFHSWTEAIRSGAHGYMADIFRQYGYSFFLCQDLKLKQIDAFVAGRLYLVPPGLEP